MALSVAEREKFLAEPHIGALSVVERPDRAPLVVPIWYSYTPGGELWVRTQPDSRKARAIAAAGRFSMMAQRTEPTARYVSVEGPVTRTAADTEELALEMAERYLPPDKAAEFVAFEREQIGTFFAIYMRPEHWLSLDMGPA
ncbi:pyridoxamine 5'-phosphate oxidase family protein [Actinocrispum sp. NPDC049592]|uniref:pyridoxamine 5'-phosphate oxidase family protein n=1 Tax=Actinocrispum sp. NPDC049592 TaxID=3154835 RepID=UPI003431F34C